MAFCSVTSQKYTILCFIISANYLLRESDKQLQISGWCNVTISILSIINCNNTQSQQAAYSPSGMFKAFQLDLPLPEPAAKHNIVKLLMLAISWLQYFMKRKKKIRSIIFSRHGNMYLCNYFQFKFWNNLCFFDLKSVRLPLGREMKRRH